MLGWTWVCANETAGSVPVLFSSIRLSYTYVARMHPQEALCEDVDTRHCTNLRAAF